MRILKMNNSLINTTAFMLIITRAMKLPIAKLCLVCLGGVIVVNYGNKRLFPKLHPPMARFANVVKKTTS
jgi:hypothetical protein